MNTHSMVPLLYYWFVCSWIRWWLYYIIIAPSNNDLWYSATSPLFAVASALIFVTSSSKASMFLCTHRLHSCTCAHISFTLSMLLCSMACWRMLPPIPGASIDANTPISADFSAASFVNGNDGRTWRACNTARAGILLVGSSLLHIYTSRCNNNACHVMHMKRKNVHQRSKYCTPKKERKTKYTTTQHCYSTNNILFFSNIQSTYQNNVLSSSLDKIVTPLHNNHLTNVLHPS